MICYTENLKASTKLRIYSKTCRIPSRVRSSIFFLMQIFVTFLSNYISFGMLMVHFSKFASKFSIKTCFFEVTPM